LDPFNMALRRIELKSGRLLQAQILFLKSADLLPFRAAVNSVVENRHQQVRTLCGFSRASACSAPLDPA
jgi:hypothetical protein